MSAAPAALFLSIGGCCDCLCRRFLTEFVFDTALCAFCCDQSVGTRHRQKHHGKGGFAALGSVAILDVNLGLVVHFFPSVGCCAISFVSEWP